MLKFFIYLLYYISVFIIGFFGVAPIFLLNSTGEKIPYIILSILGIGVLSGLLILYNIKTNNSNKEDKDEEVILQGEQIEAQ